MSVPHDSAATDDAESSLSSLTASTNASEIDLVGHPLAVLESDPGLFTTLTRKLGIRGVEVVELYDIEPWAVDHLAPRGLIFCFLWHKDSHRPADFADPAAEKVWFANQLIDDACASQAILNVVLNCPEVDIGDTLRVFRTETADMSPAMKGLAIFNLPLIRDVHNSLARPADIRAAVHAAAKTTFKTAAGRRRSASSASSSSSAAPRSKSDRKKRLHRKRLRQESEDLEESYHFIGYVPAHGKVWELDGLKSGPLEVGEIPPSSPSPSSSSSNPATAGWMSVARPALRMKMQKYGGDNIKFNLLALVDDLYESACDRLEMCKRDKIALERRLSEVSGHHYNPTSPEQNHAHQRQDQRSLYSPPEQEPDQRARGRVFAPDFSLRAMHSAVRISQLQPHRLREERNACLENAALARAAVEEEVANGIRVQSEHIKRTHDYEPFIQQFFTCLENEGLLRPLLNRIQRPRNTATKSRRRRAR